MELTRELSIILWIIIPVFGLLTGSFLNVCIYRMPMGESIIFPSSRCGRCKTQLSSIDLVPVFSHLFLLGRCRYCGSSVSFRYSLVEILTCLFFSFSFYWYGLTVAFFVYTALITSLIVITFIDYDCQIIPDEISIGGTITGLIIALLFSLYPGYSHTGLKIGLMDSLLGFSSGFFLLYAISVLTGGGMGGGDVKLAGMLGTFLGAKGVLLALLIACFLGASGGVFLIVTKLKGRKDLIPFGPYIAIGSLIVLFLGPDLILSKYHLLLGI